MAHISIPELRANIGANGFYLRVMSSLYLLHHATAVFCDNKMGL